LFGNLAVVDEGVLSMKRKWLMITIAFLAALGLIYLLLRPAGKGAIQPASVGQQKTAEKQPARPIPTAFIHGWKGGTQTFGSMINRLAAAGHGVKRTMTVRITPQGVVHVTRLSSARRPLIQIIFENNQGSIAQQAVWLNHAMRTLKKAYGIKRMNVVSHSMGGESFVYYLETIRRRDDYPIIEKYVAIAAPFDWIDGVQDDLNYSLSQRKQRSILYQRRGQIPSSLNVLAIAGLIESDHPLKGDGMVPLRSALFGRYLFNPAHYSERIVRGTGATHSGLHKSPAVDRLTARFLWGIDLHEH
jgi:uncharacterized alpha/beta hydrolase family protein